MNLLASHKPNTGCVFFRHNGFQTHYYCEWAVYSNELNGSVKRCEVDDPTSYERIKITLPPYNHLVVRRIHSKVFRPKTLELRHVSV